MLGVAVLADFDLFYKVFLWWLIGSIGDVVGTAEVVEWEGVIEEVPERVVQDVVLRIPIVSKQDGIELATILLSHPVKAIEICSRRGHQI